MELSRMSNDSNRNHRRSIRAQSYDYAGNGTYFVTICTAGREQLFGRVTSGGMAMNEFGWIVWEEWERSAQIRNEVEVGPFVVMPNHLHGIVTINPSESAAENRSASRSSKIVHVESPGRRPLGAQPRSLSSFVGGFKGAATKQINEIRGTPGAVVWQRNYYERIVRDEREMSQIWAYIENNPLGWAEDQENPEFAGQNSSDERLRFQLET
jgi:REP element-mobilizing transposase RayT